MGGTGITGAQVVDGSYRRARAARAEKARCVAGGLFVGLAAFATLVFTPVADAASGCRVEIANTRPKQAFTDLQTAVTAVAPGGTLVVRGTCEGATLDKDLTIRGQSDPVLGAPTLDGGGLGSVLRISGATTIIALNGLTVTHGQAVYGGGIYNEGQVALKGSAVSDNTASEGGGLYNTPGASMTATDTSISNNTADGNGGGGIYNNSGATVKLRRSSGVVANTSTQGYGGGINNASGAVILQDNSVVTQNVASIAIGGGIFNAPDGSVTLSDRSSITENVTRGGGGGGIYNFGRVLLTGASSIARNTAGNNGQGGGVFNSGGALTPNNGIVTLTNVSIISGNSAVQGGGIYTVGGMVTLVNKAKIGANTASAAGGGGGIFFRNEATLVNCIAGLNVLNNIAGGEPNDIAGM
ncbi:MAG TPA: hypothetical protein VGO31_15515 [Microbacteriaceae bacterium]|jgi:hypothetical protein|nr:hypothetical protein [Microbacteriaceae bacterium]